MVAERRPRIDVVGLGPAGPDLTGLEAARLLGSAKAAFLRTRHHPAAEPFAHLPSFDHLYERSEATEDVYAAIVEVLVQAALLQGEALYAVPGSPTVAERSVELLAARPEVEVVVHPATSFLDLVWLRLGVDPVAVSVRLVDAERFAEQSAGQRGPLLVAQCWSRELLSDVKLSVERPPGQPVTVLQRLGMPDERCFSLPWDELDREVEADHLTCLWIPELSSPLGAEMARLEELARTLRRRCPWDAKQSHGSLARYLREEAFEALDAISSLQQALDAGSDPYGAGGQDLGALDAAAGELEEELGDLLYQVVFHSVLASEEGLFGLSDVARGVHDKLHSRHPHVFGGAEAKDAEEVLAAWEEQKKAEKGRKSRFEGIPSSLPALAYAQQLRRRASGLGDQEEADVVGELLFAVAEMASKLGVDAEAALRAAVASRRRSWGEQEAAGEAGSR